VFALVLVCTSVFMTQKPPWMEGKEADLGISSPFIGPDPSSQPYNYNNPQMHDMAPPRRTRTRTRTRTRADHRH